MRAALAVALLLAGCAAVPRPAETFFDDAGFGPPSRRIEAQSVFAVSDAMRRYLRDEIGEQIAAKGPQQGLYDALYAQGRLKLEYDAGRTRNAAEAFDERAGNCLSLVVMTAALARELGLEVTFRQFVGDDAWTRSGETYFAASHVNLVLSRRVVNPRSRRVEEQQLTVDFVPPKPGEVPQTRELARDTIVAMYMNNRAAEELAAGSVDDAYWWARAAIAEDPAYASAYNTLAVIYKHRGKLALAERVLRFVLAREPGSVNAMQNLALVLGEQGREREADLLSAQVERRETNPPFHFLDLGREAMQRGDFRAAKGMFLRELERDADYHEVHYWLALVCMRLGEIDAAREHLATAARTGVRATDRALYAAKLARLKAAMP
jgi:Tfp pilus assembly protein PilF